MQGRGKPGEPGVGLGGLGGRGAWAGGAAWVGGGPEGGAGRRFWNLSSSLLPGHHVLCFVLALLPVIPALTCSRLTRLSPVHLGRAGVRSPASTSSSRGGAACWGRDVGAFVLPGSRVPGQLPPAGLPSPPCRPHRQVRPPFHLTAPCGTAWHSVNHWSRLLWSAARPCVGRNSLA